MKRLRRAIYRGMSIAFSLISIAAVGLWARSYFPDGNLAVDRLILKGEWVYSVKDSIKLGSGGIRFARLVAAARFPNNPNPPMGFTACGYGDLRVATYPQSVFDDGPVLGFSFGKKTYRESGNIPIFWAREVIVPFWFPLAIFAALYVPRAWQRHLEQNREQEGLCRACGYDLRATPHRCPECGTYSHGPVNL